ncbi:MAG: hypothetical protein GY822_15890 [Deltaproteobacteria bacterium]|nr:hypothetical protein [Deltaproteobacteria bacterium]
MKCSPEVFVDVTASKPDEHRPFSLRKGKPPLPTQPHSSACFSASRRVTTAQQAQSKSTSSPPEYSTTYAQALGL